MAVEKRQTEANNKYWDTKNGEFASPEKEGYEPKNVKDLNLKIESSEDLEKKSKEIIEAYKPVFLNKMKSIIGLEDIVDIKHNNRENNKEVIDDNLGKDYYLETESGAVLSMDDKSSSGKENFSFTVYKSDNQKDVTAWFTNGRKENDLVSFSNLITDENNNVIGCEYDIFDSSCLAYCVYSHIGLDNPEIQPDEYLYIWGRSLARKAKFGKSNEIFFDYKKKNGQPVDGAYVRIKSSNKGKIFVSIEINKDKIRKLSEDDEHQFLKF